MEKFVKNLKRGGLPTRCWLYMLILLLSFGLPASIFAQTDLVKVTGTVTDETNQPVPGVNVLLKGSSNIGTVTDIEGKYTLNIPKDATLIFKFVGYKTTEVAVNGKTTVNLSIQPDVKQLEDVVVIGYQAIKREKSTAAIASVAGEKIENIPVPSVKWLYKESGRFECVEYYRRTRCKGDCHFTWEYQYCQPGFAEVLLCMWWMGIVWTKAT